MCVCVHVCVCSELTGMPERVWEGEEGEERERVRSRVLVVLTVLPTQLVLV